jgi:hypothetical protein
MSIQVDCPACHKHLKVPADTIGRSAKCPSCGHVWTVSDPGEVSPPRQELGVYRLRDDDGRPPAPIPVEPIDAAPTQEAEWVTPIDPTAPAAAPAGTGATDSCPNCKKPMQPEAVLCINCGFNRRTGKQLKTVSRRLESHWDTVGFPYWARLLVYVLFLFLAPLLVSVLVLLIVNDPVAVQSIVKHATLGLVILLSWMLLCLLALGTLRRVTITRNVAGKALLIRQWWVGFLPVHRSTLDLERYTTIRLSAKHTVGLDLQSLLFMLLFLFLCGLPGVVYAMIRLSTTTRIGAFTLEIGGDADITGAEDVERIVICRERSEVGVRRLGDALEQIAGMRYG